MSVWPCNLKGATCTLLFCLCTINLILAMLYMLYFKDGRVLATNFSAHLAKVTPKENASEAEMYLCPETPLHLVGPLRIEFYSPVSMEFIQKENPEVVEGGQWWPRDCIARQKVAIIIPFRDRESHLKYWLYYLHPILQRQQLNYGIYVINQYGQRTFNRGKLMNVGYAEAQKEFDYECFVFSDVDIVPMDDRNLYQCYSQPRHLSVAVDKFGFRLPYREIFGGVTALSLEQFTKINGYPNNYWGWGGEDDDVYQRLLIRGMSISRPDGQTGQCRMIKHQMEAHNTPNPQRFDNLKLTKQTINSNGLNSLQYRVVSVQRNPLYTNITVDIDRP